MEIKIISQSGEVLRDDRDNRHRADGGPLSSIGALHVLHPEDFNSAEGGGTNCTVTENTVRLERNNKNVHTIQTAVFARKVWKVWATTGHENAVPIATFDTLEEAYSAATQTEIHPVCHVSAWHHERGWEKLSPFKSPSGFFVQEAWV